MSSSSSMYPSPVRDERRPGNRGGQATGRGVRPAIAPTPQPEPTTPPVARPGSWEQVSDLGVRGVRLWELADHFDSDQSAGSQFGNPRRPRHPNYKAPARRPNPRKPTAGAFRPPTARKGRSVGPAWRGRPLAVGTAAPAVQRERRRGSQASGQSVRGTYARKPRETAATEAYPSENLTFFAP